MDIILLFGFAIIPDGPFETLDKLGLPIALDIIEQYQKVPGIISPVLKKMMFPYNFKGIKKALGDLVAQGKHGVTTGEGFYKYVNGVKQ